MITKKVSQPHRLVPNIPSCRDLENERNNLDIETIEPALIKQHSEALAVFGQSVPLPII